MEATEQQQTEPQAPDKDPSETLAPPADNATKKPEAPPKPAGNEDNYWKRQAEKFEKEAKALQREKLTEAERLKIERDEALKRAEAAEGSVKEVGMERKFLEMAGQSGLRPQAAKAAFLLARDHLTQTEDGKIMGGERAVAALKKDHAYLFEADGKLGSGGGNTKPAAAGQTTSEKMNNWIRRKLK